MSGEEYPEVMDSAMVSEMLGMNIQVVRRMAREGEIPAYRLPGGRTFRFFRDEVLEWLRGYPVVPEDETAEAVDAEETRPGI